MPSPVIFRLIKFYLWVFFSLFSISTFYFLQVNILQNYISPWVFFPIISFSISSFYFLLDYESSPSSYSPKWYISMSTSFPIIFISLFSALLRELPKLIFSKRTYLYEYVFFPSFFFFLFLYSALRRKFPKLIFSKMIYLSISFSHQLFFYFYFLHYQIFYRS